MLSIPQYNLSSLFCIPNMKFLPDVIVEISFTKYVVRKKKGHIQGRMNAGSQSLDVFDEKCREKEKWINTEMNK